LWQNNDNLIVYFYLNQGSYILDSHIICGIILKKLGKNFSTISRLEKSIFFMIRTWLSLFSQIKSQTSDENNNVDDNNNDDDNNNNNHIEKYDNNKRISVYND